MSDADLLFIFIVLIMAGVGASGYVIGWWARGKNILDWPPEPRDILAEIRELQRKRSGL